MTGLINLYKPPLISSAQAVGKVKKILSTKKVGHMGTLDPMAEGVLIIGVGKAARLFDFLSNHKKTYEAKFTFGYETDTLDRLGKTIKTTEDIPSSDAVLHCLQAMRGEFEQIPPSFSAKHVNGRRAYELARSGEEVILPPKKVELYSAALISQPKENEMVFELSCSSGTYIRSIVRDAAHSCGSLATLTYLKRTKVGNFAVENSVTLDELEAEKQAAVIDVASALSGTQIITIDGKNKSDLDCGRKVKAEFSGDALIFCENELYGIGKAENGLLKLTTYLKE